VTRFVAPKAVHVHVILWLSWLLLLLVRLSVVPIGVRILRLIVLLALLVLTLRLVSVCLILVLLSISLVYGLIGVTFHDLLSLRSLLVYLLPDSLNTYQFRFPLSLLMLPGFQVKACFVNLQVKHLVDEAFDFVSGRCCPRRRLLRFTVVLVDGHM
jgi:hypothetical protein